MARNDKTKDQLEGILVATDPNIEAYKNRWHNQFKAFMDTLDLRSIDHPQWLVEIHKETEPLNRSEDPVPVE